MKTLLQMPLNQAASIVEVAGPRAFRRRLMELGLVPGTEIVILAVAPLGDPLEIEVRSARLSIRKHEAAMIAVRADG